MKKNKDIYYVDQYIQNEEVFPSSDDNRTNNIEYKIKHRVIRGTLKGTISENDIVIQTFNSSNDNIIDGLKDEEVSYVRECEGFYVVKGSLHKDVLLLNWNKRPPNNISVMVDYEYEMECNANLEPEFKPGDLAYHKLTNDRVMVLGIEADSVLSLNKFIIRLPNYEEVPVHSFELEKN
jgi:hypothetical protein